MTERDYTGNEHKGFTPPQWLPLADKWEEYNRLQKAALVTGWAMTGLGMACIGAGAIYGGAHIVKDLMGHDHDGMPIGLGITGMANQTGTIPAIDLLQTSVTVHPEWDYAPTVDVSHAHVAQTPSWAQISDDGEQDYIADATGTVVIPEATPTPEDTATPEPMSTPKPPDTLGEWLGFIQNQVWNKDSDAPKMWLEIHGYPENHDNLPVPPQIEPDCENDGDFCPMLSPWPEGKVGKGLHDNDGTIKYRYYAHPGYGDDEQAMENGLGIVEISNSYGQFGRYTWPSVNLVSLWDQAMKAQKKGEAIRDFSIKIHIQTQDGSLIEKTLHMTAVDVLPDTRITGAMVEERARAVAPDDFTLVIKTCLGRSHDNDNGLFIFELVPEEVAEPDLDIIE